MLPGQAAVSLSRRWSASKGGSGGPGSLAADPHGHPELSWRQLAACLCGHVDEAVRPKARGGIGQHGRQYRRAGQPGRSGGAGPDAPEAVVRRSPHHGLSIDSLWRRRGRGIYGIPDRIITSCDDHVSALALAHPSAGWRIGGETRLRRTTLQGLPGWKGPVVSEDSSVSALVARVCEGDQEAWNEIIERYAPLVWSICLRYQLSRPDIDDVGQSVWLLLIENIGKLRDAAALPGWLATTTRRECLRTLRAAQRHDHADLPPEEHMPLDADAATIEQEIIVAERNAALRAAFAELAPSCHELLSMLISDPPASYADISTRLGLPVGSIGPTRARCLERLRRSPHLTGIVGDDAPQVDARKGR
jgi:RNA polymerase sigma factor (sigma-70 family)